MISATPTPVTHHPATAAQPEGRFEAVVDGHAAHADYRLQDGRAVFHHTEVPAELGGRGLAAQLVEAGLQWARDAGLPVVATCPYVAAYVQRHPQWQDLLAR